MTRPASAVSPRQQMIAELHAQSRGVCITRDDSAEQTGNHNSREMTRTDEHRPAGSARDMRAMMIEGLNGAAPRRLVTDRQDAAPGATQARADMVAGLGASGGPRVAGIMNAGPYASAPVSSAASDGRQVIRSPNEVVAYWEGLKFPETKRREEMRTANAMRQLLLRKGRREFPYVPVLFDGRRMAGIVLDAAWTYLRLAKRGSGRAGLGPDFDPLDFLVTNLPRAEASLKRGKTVPGEWPANQWAWEQNTAEDIREDQQAGFPDFRMLAAPLVLTTPRGPLTDPAAPASAA